VAPKYHKVRINTDMNILNRVNFNKICEHRSKSMFLLHSLKVDLKYDKASKTIYGERTKYILWLSQDTALVCNVKVILDDVLVP